MPLKLSGVVSHCVNGCHLAVMLNSLDVVYWKAYQNVDCVVFSSLHTAAYFEAFGQWFGAKWTIKGCFDVRQITSKVLGLI
jgi:hypothetical protein